MQNKAKPEAWLVYPAGMAHKYLAITATDVKETVAKYTDTYGPPNAIALSPKNVGLLPESLKDISLFTPGGCLAFEIWLPEKPLVAKIRTAHDAPPGANPAAETQQAVKNVVRKPEKQKSKAKTNRIIKRPPKKQGIMQHGKRGRPRKEGEVHRTTLYRRMKAEQLRLV